MTIKEAAAHHGVSDKTIRRWIKQGLVKRIKPNVIFWIAIKIPLLYTAESTRTNQPQSNLGKEFE